MPTPPDPLLAFADGSASADALRRIDTLAERYRGLRAAGLTLPNAVEAIRVELTYHSNALEGSTLTLRDTAFQRPESYFHRFAVMGEPEARATAGKIWDDINAVNLTQNIASTRDRATVVLRKGPTHDVTEVSMRRALAPGLVAPPT